MVAILHLFNHCTNRNAFWECRSSAKRTRNAKFGRIEIGRARPEYSKLLPLWTADLAFLRQGMFI